MNEEKSASTGDFDNIKSNPSDEKKITKRIMLPVLTRLFKNKGKFVTYGELQTECKEWGIMRGCQPEIIDRSINWLIEKGFPISRTDDNNFYWDYLTASQLLDETKALEALHTDTSSKTHLAKKVVEVLESEYKNLVQNLFMGGGTTVYFVFREILESRNSGKLNLDKLYTDNMLIIFEYMHKKPNFDLVTLNGRLYRDSAIVEADKTHLRKDMPVTLSITSFKGFNSTHGFSSDDRKIKNKIMSLKPHDKTEIVIVPMSLHKFDPLLQDTVATTRHLKKGIKYIFVTEMPTEDEPKKHIQTLKDLKEKGFSISFEYVIPPQKNVTGRFEIQEISSNKRSKSQKKSPVK